MPVPHRRPRRRDADRPVRVLAVYDGEVDRAQQVIALVRDELDAVLGDERNRVDIEVRELDLAVERSPRRQRAWCRAAEIVVGLDAQQLQGLARPPLTRHRVFTLEELTLTLEMVANSAYGRAVVSIIERGLPAFSRSVIAAASATKGLASASFVARRRAETIEEYAPRLAHAIGELAIGRAL